MISKKAAMKGTVFVQCGGCEQWHIVADNLSVAEEWRLNKDTGKYERWKPDPLPDPTSAATQNSSDDTLYSELTTAIESTIDSAADEDSTASSRDVDSKSDDLP